MISETSSDVDRRGARTAPVYVVPGVAGHRGAGGREFVLEMVHVASRASRSTASSSAERDGLVTAHRGRTGGRRGARVPELSYFFPAHNEEANLEALVAEALEALPALAERFEIIIVDDGSRDATAAIADRLAATTRTSSASSTTRRTYGYGAALRSGFRAARYAADRVHRRRPPVQGRGPRPAHGAARGRDHPDVVVGLPDQARGPARSGPSTRGSTGSRTGSSSGSASATWTAPASCSGARRSRASAWSRAARSSPPSCCIKLAAERPAARGGRRAALPADGRLADRREARASSGAR